MLTLPYLQEVVLVEPGQRLENRFHYYVTGVTDSYEESGPGSFSLVYPGLLDGARDLLPSHATDDLRWFRTLSQTLAGEEMTPKTTGQPANLTEATPYPTGTMADETAFTRLRFEITDSARPAFFAFSFQTLAGIKGIKTRQPIFSITDFRWREFEIRKRIERASADQRSVLRRQYRQGMNRDLNGNQGSVVDCCILAVVTDPFFPAIVKPLPESSRFFCPMASNLESIPWPFYRPDDAELPHASVYVYEVYNKSTGISESPKYLNVVIATYALPDLILEKRRAQMETLSPLVSGE
ncbi:MAG: hypothetical protein A3J59_03815 [Candidatus Buchananbacteria bacterium RIFCSPHIGHO2_02_FULL_56_16]|uniref:Uncharacterized protein n=1 Tax=Candidatus Buchananbacteria bacterium RIFCSPHIGHO2_02_FULL_56_16 TaxID=1797542 RepID=A0A1G1YI56_9BACT|nr:MAG: hypothetical protein A3J59_03815 [Candidatus Buchananbacteria bacterium RIFCSPHIGHO2_02_FULL_56_16]